jgi:hypothetical protein
LLPPVVLNLLLLLLRLVVMDEVEVSAMSMVGKSLWPPV